MLQEVCTDKAELHQCRSELSTLSVGVKPDGGTEKPDFSPEFVARLKTQAEKHEHEISEQRKAMAAECEDKISQLMSSHTQEVERIRNEAIENATISSRDAVARITSRGFSQWRLSLPDLKKAHEAEVQALREEIFMEQK